MNEHLEPIFNTVLVELEKTGIDYWVYAGIGIAGCVGRFIRKNKDVDIFVKEVDFDRATSVLTKLFSQLDSFMFDLNGILKRGNYERPKWEAKIVGQKGDIFSMVPTFEGKDNVIMVFDEGAKSFSKKILNKVERNISSYRFFIPPRESVKEIFLYCLSKRKDWQKRKSKRMDGEAILSPDEFKKAFPS